MISWLKANMRATFTDTISADVLRQLQAGTNPVDVTLDVSAPHLKRMLALAFAKALSELPAESFGKTLFRSRELSSFQSFSKWCALSRLTFLGNTSQR